MCMCLPLSGQAGQDTATDYLEILNDVSLMLFTEYDHVIKHAINRIGEFPSAAEVRVGLG